MTWATDGSRYGSRHRWQRKQALKDVAGRSCTRCRQPLIPAEYEVRPGVYQLPRGWLSRHIHLDHRDGSDTSYLGLAHASCNTSAARRQRDPVHHDVGSAR